MIGNLRSRLAKLERVVCETTGGGRCQMCQGDPQAVFLVVHELAPDRKSIRITGDIYLGEESMGSSPRTCTTRGVLAAARRHGRRS